MDLSLSPSEEAFRREFATWLEANLPADWTQAAIRSLPDDEQLERRKAGQMRYALLLLGAVAGALAFACSDGARDAYEAYGISVTFNAATRAEFTAVEDYLKDLDPTEFLSQDSEPPIFSVRWTSPDVPCDTVKAELQSRDYVRQVECEDGDVPLVAPDG